MAKRTSRRIRKLVEDNPPAPIDSISNPVGGVDNDNSLASAASEDYKRLLEQASSKSVCELGKPGPPDLSDEANWAALGSAARPRKKTLTMAEQIERDALAWQNNKKEKSREVVTSVGAPRRVTLVRDTSLVYPDLFLEVFVHGPAGDCAGFPEMFARARCSKAASPDEADLVVFTGGADVDPIFYDAEHNPHPSVYSSEERDKADMAVYLECVNKGIPMLGVCRGAQLLHVMNGGSLYQDVDNHNGDHGIFEFKSKKFMRASSVHHQMCIDNTEGGMEIVATAQGKSRVRWKNAGTREEGTNKDIEAFYYPATAAFGVQGHPEYAGYHMFTIWVLEKLNEFLILNPEITWGGPKNNRRRLKVTAMEDAAQAEALIQANVTKGKK